MSRFECSRCGACCKLIGTLPEMRNYDRGDGACVHLTADNECAIYNERPRICRVDAMQPPVMTADEWHKRNTAACGRLQLQVYGQLVR